MTIRRKGSQADIGRATRTPRRAMIWFLAGMCVALLTLTPYRTEAGVPSQPSSSEARNQAAKEAVKQYAEAVAAGDRVTAGRLDFICQLRIVQATRSATPTFPTESDPVYDWCWNRIQRAHEEVIESRDRGLDAIWPGRGALVDYADFRRFLISETGALPYPPSVFVTPYLNPSGESPLTVEPVETFPVPHASFQAHEGTKVVAAPTTMVHLRVSYPDPLTAPVANAPGTTDWAAPVKHPKRVIDSILVKWIVLSGLLKLGFPSDIAILDIPIQEPNGTTTPFVMEVGGYVPGSIQWWRPDAASPHIEEAVEHISDLEDRLQRVALLNRVLILNPSHKPALRSLADELYTALLEAAQDRHHVRITSPILAQRFDELFWTVQSQTDRFDISLDMAMGGRAEPTPADYLYRMIPVLETLVKMDPSDFETRFRLGMAYRWTNHQVAAIATHEKLVEQASVENPEQRAQALVALAWSRITKVAWNRSFNDPDLDKAYQEAEQALTMTANPLEKFLASYAMAYSLAFTPDRNNRTMVELLTDAERWFDRTPGATQTAWRYLLANDTLKGVIQADPSFEPLLDLS